MLPHKKIVAFDIDGTLTVSKSPITMEMAELLKPLIKERLTVAISGGDLEQFKTQFLPPFMNDYSFRPFLKNLKLLPTSGTKHYEYDENRGEWYLVSKEPLPEDVKQRAKDAFREIINSGLYEIPPNPKGEIVEDRDTQITFSALGQRALPADKKAWDPDQRKRKKIKAAIAPMLPDASILINAYSSIDIVPKGFNKGVGLLLLLKKLGFRRLDMIFVGDGLFPGGNDYSVFEAGIETIAVTGPDETEEIIKKWIG